jgi:shikimate dehydrogenase
MNTPPTFRLAGVMGWPVAHSRSPLLHGHWIGQYGLAGAYVPLPVQPGRVEAALRGLSALGFAGCNITLPHKVEAMRFVDHVDPRAKRAGAINCIVVAADGSLAGFNHDVFGFVESLRSEAPAWRAAAGPAVVLGAGGAARAVLVGLIDEGAPEIRLLNRTDSKAAALAEEFGSPVRALLWSERHRALEGCVLLVNTTTQGMQGHPPLDLELDALPRTALVSDLIYVPRATPLLAAAAARGNAAVGGLGMLLHQARPAFHSWFGVMPEVSAELRAKIEATL